MDNSSAAYSLLEQLDRVLEPLHPKIRFSLHVGTVGQMRADLEYLRDLLGEAHAEIKKVLDAGC